MILASGAPRWSRGSSCWVTRKWARWLTPQCCSWPSVVRLREKVKLWIRTFILGLKHYLCLSNQVFWKLQANACRTHCWGKASYQDFKTRSIWTLECLDGQEILFSQKAIRIRFIRNRIYLSHAEIRLWLNFRKSYFTEIRASVSIKRVNSIKESNLNGIHWKLALLMRMWMRDSVSRIFVQKERTDLEKKLNGCSMLARWLRPVTAKDENDRARFGPKVPRERPFLAHFYVPLFAVTHL